MEECEMFGRFSKSQIESMPTVSEGHTDDLKLDLGYTRVWVSRLTTEDGVLYDNEVTTEQYLKGERWFWKPIDTYEPTDYSDFTNEEVADFIRFTKEKVQG